MKDSSAYLIILEMRSSEPESERTLTDFVIDLFDTEWVQDVRVDRKTRRGSLFVHILICANDRAFSDCLSRNNIFMKTLHRLDWDSVLILAPDLEVDSNSYV